MTSNQTLHRVDLFNNDLYQFTCSYSYFVQNMHQQQATFEIFFRKYPFGGQYVIFAGLDAVKNFVKNFIFSKEHEQYLREVFPHIKPEYFQWIRQEFSSKVTFRGMKEGEIVFANQPLLSYTGPLGFVQLLETPFLNLLGFASLVTTNASRMTKAVNGKKCIQFGTRRAQGPDGALSASHYSYLGGFFATSNVEVAQKLGIKCVGTMSHAYVTSFNSLDDVAPFNLGKVAMKNRAIQIREQLGFKTHDGELAAFLNFCQAFPSNFTALIDSYSTLQSGILNAVIVGKVLIEAGIKQIGIRLDSGDLCQLSKHCRSIWSKYIKDVKLQITASDDLYEERLIEMEKKKSQIDVYAIGTNIATCKKQPALGLVCKLVELNGVPKMKLASNTEKTTYPCAKNIYRIVTKDNQYFDLIALRSEEFYIEDEIEIGALKDQEFHLIKVNSIRLLNDEVDFSSINIKDSKIYLERSKAELPEGIFRLQNATNYQTYMSKDYLKSFREAYEKASIGDSINKSKKIVLENDPSSPIASTNF